MMRKKNILECVSVQMCGWFSRMCAYTCVCVCVCVCLKGGQILLYLL